MYDTDNFIDIEISTDKPPSTMQMFKLAANPKFREGARRVIDEMRNAGVNITSEVRTSAH